MKDKIQKIKNWFSEMKYRRAHNREADRLNSELESRYYKIKSNTIIKILSELDKKAGFNPHDIVPFLIKINLMSEKGSMVEKGNENIITDKQRNTELFNRIEKLDYIEIIENKLYGIHNGNKYTTSTNESILKIRLLPKGLDYLKEHKRRKFDKCLRMILAFFTFIGLCISFNNLAKPNKKEYDKLQKKIDSVTIIIENMKEEQLRPEKKQLQQEK